MGRKLLLKRLRERARKRTLKNVPPDGTRTPQDGPRRPPGGPRRPPGGPRTHPRRPQDSPGRPQDGPKTVQGVAKTPPRRSKTPPRRPQTPPRRPQTPQEAPKSPQEVPGTPPGTPTNLEKTVDFHCFFKVFMDFSRTSSYANFSLPQLFNTNALPVHTLAQVYLRGVWGVRGGPKRAL